MLQGEHRSGHTHVKDYLEMIARSEMSDQWTLVRQRRLETINNQYTDL